MLRLSLLNFSKIFIFIYLLHITSGNLESLLQSDEFSISFNERTKTLTLTCPFGFFDKNVLRMLSNKINYVEKFESTNCDLVNSLRHIYSKWNITGTILFNLEGFSSSIIILKKEQFYNEFILGAQELNLNNSNILKIEEFTFNDFKNLKKLSLAGNRLKELPQHFSIPSLVELNLYNNTLRNLSQTQFAYFFNLEKINLDQNHMPDLPEKLFHSLPSLKIARMSQNSFESLAERFFANNKDLIEINLGSGFLNNIGKDAFVGLTKLEKLNLNSNYLITIPIDLFKDLISLTHLDLSENIIEKLPENVFENFKNLQHLDVNRNKLSEWLKSHSKYLGNLVELNLAHNKLTKIFDDTFYGMMNLKQLTLNYNGIFSISNQAFTPLKALKRLEIGYNNLTTSNGTYSFIDGLSSRIEYLNLMENNFTSIPKNAVSKVYQYLHLARNQISFVNIEELLDFPGLYVDLTDNNIEVIKMHTIEPKEEIKSIIIFAGVNIRCDCGIYNIIRYLDYKYGHQIDGGVHFGFLGCATPDDGKWVGEFKPDEFTCDSSDLYSCPPECSCKLFPKRRTLIIDCMNKHLEFAPLPSVFTPKIYNNEEAGVVFEIEKMDVHLENNSLRSFSKNKSCYDNVSGLFLSNNNISLIDWLPSDLVVLTLDNNKLTNLKEDVMLILNMSSTLKQITLSGNLWECDSALTSSLKSIKEKVQIMDYDEIQCSNGKYLRDLEAI